MSNIWITYAWSDNEQGDVDFVAQELESAGVTIKLDRWNISAGNRLWPQIENFICSEEESDVWILIATTNSLSSEPCKEEFAYALDRALNSRGNNFPVIGLFLGSVDESLIPASIRTRLYVSITDPDWKERIIAAADGRNHNVVRQEIQPFYVKIHEGQNGNRQFAIEVRPRAGVWAPFIAGIPTEEKETVKPHIMIGPRDVPTNSGMLVNCGESESPDGKLWIMSAGNQSTPTESYYVWCEKLPSTLVFGVNGKAPQYTINLG
ncbi:MAG: toll/interleukin-1 receptor domain-containing protein [Bacteroidota bacterium]